MIEKKLFNLEKIKEITSPIEELQGKLNSLEEIYNKFIENKNIFTQNFTETNISIQIQEITQKLSAINSKLLKISKENVNKFLIFQDNLIKKYKDSFKENLKSLKLDQKFTKEIGLFLIENKKISKIIDQTSLIPAITSNQWLDLLDSLKQNSLFLSTIKKVEKFFNVLTSIKLEIELSKIPKNIDPILVKDYKKAYLNDPSITFKEFLQNIESKLTQEELKVKRKIIEETKEKEKLKKEQEEQLESRKDSYQEYFKYSDEEFQRRRRRKRREKLSDLQAKPKKEIEISKDISEKIEKFKSKSKESFKEKYLVQRDDETDPLDIIRERKKEKEEEYKDHLKKFKNKE